MQEISQFVVKEAYATYDKTTGSVDTIFFYPRNPKETNTRLGPNPEWGVEVLEKLISTGEARIATPKNPISPPNAGSVPVTKDGKIICTRRDDGAKVHKMFQAGYSGFALTTDELYSEKGMFELGQRESAEEVVLITRDRNPYLVVTPSTKQTTLESAKRLGLDYPIREVKEEFLPGKDKLKVLYENREKIFTLPNFFTMLWDIDSSSIAMQIRKLDIHSDEILPIDAEGIFNESGDGYKVHFNRESFIVDPKEIAEYHHPITLEELRYGYPMEDPQVFQSYWDDSKKTRIVYSPHNSSLEYLGPGATPVNKPFLWTPQDTLRTCLDGLGVPGYEKIKLLWELQTDRAYVADSAREQGKVNESCVIPKQFLASP